MKTEAGPRSNKVFPTPIIDKSWGNNKSRIYTPQPREPRFEIPIRYIENPALAFRELFRKMVDGIPGYKVSLLRSIGIIISQAPTRAIAFSEVIKFSKEQVDLTGSIDAVLSLLNERDFIGIYQCLHNLYVNDKERWEQCLEEEIELVSQSNIRLRRDDPTRKIANLLNCLIRTSQKLKLIVSKY